jgi:hypothetical protein
VLLQQYEGALQEVRDYIKFCQYADVQIHKELIDYCCTMKALERPYFDMPKNVSRLRGDERATNLTVCPMNQRVVVPPFQFDDTSGNEFSDHTRHIMLDSIQVARCICYQSLGKQTGLLNMTEGSRKYHVTDSDIMLELRNKLEDTESLPVHMAMGTLCNPLMQKPDQMVRTGLVTVSQGEHTVRELISQMEQYYEDKIKEEQEASITEQQEWNKWSTSAGILDGQESARFNALKERQKYIHWCSLLY